MDTVAVQNIPDRPGQELREALETQLHIAGAPTLQAYALNVSYTITPTGIGVLQDTASTRTRFTATATWSLTPIGIPTPPSVAPPAPLPTAIARTFTSPTLPTTTFAPPAPPAPQDTALARGTAVAEDALNVIDQQYFASDLETTTIDQQLAGELATQITTQIAAYFKSHPNA
jgi:LPS-assembly lipoprotein